MSFSIDSALALLRRHFQHSSFRPGQDEIIESVSVGNDTLVIMPTGGGKSLCYQIPALLSEGFALVISPLIALMKDQVDALERAGVQAAFINSSLPYSEIQQRLERARAGEYKLLYVAPERLESKQFADALLPIVRAGKISFLAVDEAHCVSEWGHDFRPSYLAIPTFNAALGNLPIVALTATATPEVQDDIVRLLALRAPKRFIRGFNRPNLRYSVELAKDKLPRLLELCEDKRGSNIVYCGSRKRVEEFADELTRRRLPALAYHGGLPEARRTFVQEKFISGECPTIIATNAFGMGVDKSNVRNVIHCDLTLSLEAYYQEAGRAGRDGEASDCTLLYHPSDRSLQEFFIRLSFPEEKVLQQVYAFLYDLHGTRLGVQSAAPVLLDDAQIANRLGIMSGAVSIALDIFQRAGILRRGSTHGQASIQFTTTRERLHEYQRNTANPLRREALLALSRTLGPESLERAVSFNIHDILRKHNIEEKQLLETIRALEYARLLRYDAPQSTGGMTLLLERMDFRRLPIDLDALAERRERAYKKLDVVQRYAETPDCKRNFILQYFQEFDVSGDCDVCSSCLQAETITQSRSARRDFLLEQILRSAAELGGRFGKSLLVDVVKAERTPKIRQYGLEKSASFGGGKEFGKAEIREELEGAISERLLTVSADMYPTISVSEKGWKRLQSIPAPFQMKRISAKECEHPNLLKRLKKIRKEMALREQIAEQSVVDDATLLLLTNLQPTSERELAKFSTIGEIFISRFSAEFLREIARYAARDEEIPTNTDLPSRLRETVALAQKGFSLREIAGTRRLTEATIAQHIQEAVEFGAPIERTFLVNEELFRETLTVIRHAKQLALREVRERLKRECEYPELRVAVAFARKSLNENH